MRPERVVLICGTGTEVGKTWVGCRLLRELSNRGVSVAARKPAQSFDIDAEGVRLGGPTDAELLASASGEQANEVCHPFRSYHLAMAPPMAAEALGLPAFSVEDLVDELAWPDRRVEVGVVESAGGVRSPQADDGDTTDVLRVLAPEVVILVADAGLGTINAARLSMDALTGGRDGDATARTIIVLDRFDGHHDIHRRNRRWLADRCGYTVIALPGEESVLADLVSNGS